MLNSLIFVLYFYLIITNPFIKLRLLSDGLYFLLRKKDFVITNGQYEERVSISLKRILKFKDKKPF